MDIKRYNNGPRGQIRPQHRPLVVVHREAIIVPKTIYISPKKSFNNIISTPNYSLMQPVLAPSNRLKKIGRVIPTNYREQHLNKALAHTASKAILFSRVMNSRQRKRPKKHKSSKVIVRRLVLGLFILIILGTTGYISYSTWQTNNRANELMSAVESPVDNVVVVSADNQVSSSEKVEANPTPTTVNPLESYSVGADLPRAIYIEKLNIAARIMPMGINSDNSLQAPTDGNDSGWYTSSAKPGQDGAILIDGHASESGAHFGLFGYLSTISNGDKIVIERGDGVKFSYSVVHVETEPLDGLDMNKMLVTYGGAKQGVNLITCAGSWTSDNVTLDQRLLVFAVLE